jgi:hypothetical protein
MWAGMRCSYGDMCVLVLFEVASEVKILQIAGHEAAVFGADHAVEHAFDSG